MVRTSQRRCVPWGLAAWLALAPAHAQPRPSFDCTRAGTPVHRLICSDDGLAQSDRALAERYAELRRTLSSEGLATLRAGQRRWLASRARCVAPASSHEQAVGCLASRYADRADELNTRYGTADGLAIEYREISRRLPRLRVDEFDSYPVLVGPRSRVDGFNRYVSQRLNLPRGMFATSGIQLSAKPPGDTTFDRHYELHRFDARLISIEIFQYHQSYFGHSWRAEYTINWDLRRDAPLHVADLFHPDRDWQQDVYTLAMKYLHEQGEVQDPESWFGNDVVNDDEAWLFEDDGALLLMGHGERSMVGASADVPIPYEELQSFLRADTPIVVEAK